jgi:transcriptional regulator with XRE-family HTH domain
MEIGKKIKRLRTEKLITQSELVGDEITRNMLSRIENGAALPSLGTVVYLAKKLGVPAGYLLSEGDEEFIFHKTAAIKNIKRAYVDKNFELCRDICLTTFDELDDELELILTDCCIGIAEERIRSGRLHEACNYLDEAIGHAEKTMFDTTTQSNSIAIMFEMLKAISPALDSNETDTIISEDLFHPAVFGNIFCKYITVILDIDKYRLFTDDIAKHSDNIHSEDEILYIMHLQARKQIVDGDFKSALITLRSIIDAETVPERLLLYMACADMEICCRETDDYKGAYEFSQNKLEILEHMLAE